MLEDLQETGKIRNSKLKYRRRDILTFSPKLNCNLTGLRRHMTANVVILVGVGDGNAECRTVIPLTGVSILSTLCS